jgi:hypothetical protein
VTTRYVCPECGGEHSAAEHGIAHLEHLRGLDARGLRQLRLRLLDELAASLRGGAESSHLERVALLVGRVEERLERLDGF